MKKVNWGTGIVIAFGLFMAFILSFVFRVQGNSRYDNELVTEEYYKADTRYSEVIERRQRAADWNVEPTIESVEGGIRIAFADSVASQIQNGKVSLYRPSNQKLDFGIPLSLSGSALLIPDSRLVGGLWGITIQWEMRGERLEFDTQLYR